MAVYLPNFSPPHRLVLIQGSSQTFTCDLCKAPGRGSHYRCHDCDFNLHQNCGQIPILRHTIKKNFAHHRDHDLHFLPARAGFCHFCCEPARDLYHCSDCGLVVHRNCTNAKEEVRTSWDEHPLNLVQAREPAYCNVCQKSKGFWLYRCDTCQFNIHIECLHAGFIMPKASVHPEQSSTSVHPGQGNTSVHPGQSSTSIHPGHSITSVLPGRSNTNVYPGKDNINVHPGQSSTSVLPGQSNTCNYPGQGSTSVNPGHSSTNMHPGQSSTSVYPGQSTIGINPAQSTAGVYAGQSYTSIYPVHNNTSVYPGQNNASVYPGQNNGNVYLGQIGQSNAGIYPGQGNTNFYHGQILQGQGQANNANNKLGMLENLVYQFATHLVTNLAAQGIGNDILSFDN